MLEDKQGLIILVGNIASGKSTFKKYIENSIHINDDDIVNILHGDYKKYDTKLKNLYKGIENFILTTSLSYGKTVVVDRPCMTKKTRSRYIGLANSLDSQIIIVNFKKEHYTTHAKRRFYSDNRGYDLAYWTKVAEAKDKIYEQPEYSEGVDLIIEIDMENFFNGS